MESEETSKELSNMESLEDQYYQLLKEHLRGRVSDEAFYSGVEQLAENGLAVAYHSLGERAKDAGQDEEACRLWRIGAESGDEFSQKDLALHYEMAKGVPYDNDQAILWYKTSGSCSLLSSDNQAAYHLAVLRKYAEEKFADATGFAAEQYTVGMQALLNGNLAAAVDHWYSSYLNGDPRGQVCHAWRMFHVIEDFDDDDELYFEEEEMALRAVAETFSKLSHPSGWFLMGYLYNVGICYMRNKKKAMEYYQKAADAGAEFAKERLTKINL